MNQVRKPTKRKQQKLSIELLIYRKRSHDKISQIKSAGLIIAAICRKPLNVSQMEEDLSELCKHILQQSKAINQSTDLTRKGEAIKTSFTEKRKKLNFFFGEKTFTNFQACYKNKGTNTKCTKNISDSKNQQNNSAMYNSIMADLGYYCEDLMGKPPCENAIVGVGSLAREEITPYSDFEHINLLRGDITYKTHL